MSKPMPGVDEASATPGSGRKGRGSIDRKARSAAKGPRQGPWRIGSRGTAPVELLGREDIERIHLASLGVLEEIGIDILSPAMREIARKAGADVKPGSERVRFGREVVDHHIGLAPATFTIEGRAPGRDLPIGAHNTVMGCVSSAPNCSGLGGGRRGGTFEDYRRFIKLGHALNAIHFFGGYPVEPLDIDASVRHLDCLRELIALTDKVFHPYCLGRTRIEDAIELICIARGLTRDELRSRPSMYTVVNTSSPLRIEGAMLEGMIEMARHRQPVCVTPFTLAGAMAPVTLAGALAQQNAETLAGITLLQMIEPGTPALYGSYTSNVDMKSGAPAMGTPEYVRATIASGQLARRYRLPFRSSGGNASTSVDAQSVYETSFSLWGAYLSGANLVMHAAGWLEGGLCSSFEKAVIDAEILQGLAECFQRIEVTEETLALGAIRDVGPGGHFFGTSHTLARYESAFYTPLLSDWRNFGSWVADGSRDALQRASTIAATLIDEHVPPQIDPAVVEALDAFVAKRKEEGGALDT
ncbi:MAG: trimethylamine methyltransferase family protein [Hyphomicrobiaceae bacterium]